MFNKKNKSSSSQDKGKNIIISLDKIKSSLQDNKKYSSLLKYYPLNHEINKINLKKFINASDLSVRTIIRKIIKHTLHISFERFLLSFNEIIKKLLEFRQSIKITERPIFVYLDITYENYKQKSNYTGKTNATINSSHCNPKLVYENNRNNTYYDCDLNLTYKVSDKDYSGNLHTLTQTNYETTNNVDIDYEPSNPHSIQLHQIFKNKTISIILLVIACLCLISTIVHTRMYFNNDWYRKKLCVDLLNETVQSQYPGVVINL